METMNRASMPISAPGTRTIRLQSLVTWRMPSVKTSLWGSPDHWNATQIHEKQTSGWHVIHSYWSEVKERQP